MIDLLIATENNGEVGAPRLQRSRDRQRGDQLGGHQAEAHEVGLVLENPFDGLVDSEPVDVRVENIDVVAFALQQSRDVEDAERLEPVLGLVTGEQ